MRATVPNRIRTAVSRVRAELGIDPQPVCPAIALLAETAEQVRDLKAGMDCRTLDESQIAAALDLILDGPLSHDAIYDAAHTQEAR